MKKLLHFAILIILVNYLVEATEVEQINIIGNVRYNEILYKKHIDIDYNQKVTDAVKNAIILKLFATDLVDDVKVDYKNKILNITIKERPFVRKITFNGNKKLTDEVIKDSLKLKVKESFSENLLQQDIEFINNFYRGIGLPNTEVTHKIIHSDNNLIEVVFDIKESKKAKVNSIRFYGNKIFSSRRLMDEMFTKENALLRFGRKILYNEDMLEYDVHLLTQLYYSNGYLNFEVISKNAVYNQKTNKFDIIFKISEGEKYKYGEIKITNNIKDFDPTFIKKIFSKFKYGKTFNLSSIRNEVSNLNNILENKGYNNVYVDPRMIPNEKYKTVTIDIVLDNNKEIYVGEISIRGNNKTYDEVVRKTLLLQEGDLLNQYQLERSMQKIRNFGFFDEVSYILGDGYFQNQKNIEIELKEGSSGFVNFALGFSTLDGFNGSVGLSQRNLFGRAIALNIDLSIYENSKAFGFYLNKPEIFGTNMNWSGNIFFSERDDSDNKNVNVGYDTLSYGIENNFSFRLMENLSQRVGYAFEYRNYENISQDYALILNKNNEYTSKIVNGFYYDVRDNNYNPTAGFFVGWDVDLAGLGGNKDYVKNVFRFLYYYPLTSSIVFKSEFKAGFIKSLNNPLFPSDGFYLGGYSMRGFRSGGIGPRVKSYNGGDVRNSYGIGGTELYYGNFELKLPLGLPKEIEIYGVLFLNFGLTTSVEDNPEIRKDLIVDSKSFRSAYGFSIIWQTVMGNIGVDFSKVLKMEYYDISENFRFSIGTRF